MAAWRRWSEHGAAPVAGAVAVAIVVGVFAERRSVGLADPGVWLPDLLVGVVMVAVGAALWARDYKKVGTLMIAAGLTWFVGNFAGERVEWIASASRHLTLVHRALVFVALLAFPLGLLRRRTEWFVAAISVVAVLPVAAGDEWWTIAWAVGVFASFAAVVYTRTAVLRAAGQQVLPALAVFSIVLIGTSVMRWTLGDSPPPRATILVYQAGLVVTAVYLFERAIDWHHRAAEVADAIVEITLGPGGNVRTLLARALRDPSVEVAFAAHHDGAVAWYDEAGLPVERLSASGRSVVPISVGGERVAEIASSVGFESSPALLAAVGSATRLAAEHARLRADLRSQIELLTSSRRRLLAIADEERVALAAQLEADAGRTLGEIRALLDGLTTNGDVDDAVRRSNERLDSLERDLASLAAGLGPAELSLGGFDMALDQLAANGAVPVTVTVHGSTATMPPPVASTLYFVCAEAIANATKHANASTVGVTLDSTADRWVLRIDDDGCGGADVGAGSGLPRLVDRVGALGGRLTVDSPEGAGTRLTAELPRG